MKILLVHNYYQQSGGEDSCFADEGRLLEERGHDVVRYTLHNDAIKKDGPLRTAARALWSRETYRELAALIARERPAVMHCTNTFPLISPAAYYAAGRRGVAVVQALHNYRLICPGALLMRDGAACRDCVGKRFARPSIRHACYRESRAGTAVIAAMTAAHRARGTWRKAVDRYYALTEFAREQFIAGGLPADKLMIKPNFVFPSPESFAGRRDTVRSHFLYVGRLSAEKGILTAIQAWSHLSGARLRIIGDGPLADDVRRAAAANDRIEWLGPLPHARVMEELRQARALLTPSLCFENFPRSIVEAYSVGAPVIASRHGAMVELVDEGRTGLLFAPGDGRDLAAAVERLDQSPAAAAEMGESAQEAYRQKYTPERNYKQLMEIYRQAIAARASAGDNSRQSASADSASPPADDAESRSGPPAAYANEAAGAVPDDVLVPEHLREPAAPSV